MGTSLDMIASVYTKCLNTHRTHETVYNSSNDNVEFFFVSDSKIIYYNNYYSSITIPWTGEENILPHYLFGSIPITLCLKIDTVH